MYIAGSLCLAVGILLGWLISGHIWRLPPNWGDDAAADDGDQLRLVVNLLRRRRHFCLRTFEREAWLEQTGLG